jgi:hypothetical protein
LAAHDGGISIVDDLAAEIPITCHELDVIETYLGDLLEVTLSGPGK